MSENIKYGRIGWIDLTIDNAEKVRDFYSAVADWKAEPLSMGDYNDYVMMPVDGSDAAAGVCNARGENTGIPPFWMIYINVKDIEKSIAECKRLGGKVIKEIRKMGSYGRYAVIKDPAGAYSALFEPTAE